MIIQNLDKRHCQALSYIDATSTEVRCLVSRIEDNGLDIACNKFYFSGTHICLSS